MKLTIQSYGTHLTRVEEFAFVVGERALCTHGVGGWRNCV